LAQLLKDTLSLRWNESSEAYFWHVNAASLRWREIAGDVKQDKPAGSYHDFNEGCRLFRKQHISIPQLLSQIAFSVVRVGDVEYIAGMRFTPREGAVIHLGYWAEGKGHSLDITTLRGFNLAIGSRGIQAIQVITDKRCASQWFGCPDESPKTQYLAVSEHIGAVEAGFDVSRAYLLLVPP
jgi:hypothetical protein